MRDLKFVTIFPDDNYFTWQVHLWLESLREINLSDKAIVLIFTPNSRDQNKNKYQQIIDLYPETEWNWYKDWDKEVTPNLNSYIPILRPWTAMKYWQDHPEMKEKVIFYCDCDILFTKNFNIEKFLDDDIVYCSDTNSYINASYFDSKIRDVLPEKLEEYKKIDVLDNTAKLSGIDRSICEKNNMHSGGTQYILKNIDEDYWRRVYFNTFSIKRYLGWVNKNYFPSEAKGFQSWTADMWGVLWELWRRGIETKVVRELDFCWVHDSISKLEKCGIYHNAGATNQGTDDFPIFYKGKYHSGSDPTIDPHLIKVINSEKTKQHSIWYYANKLMELKNKYNLKY